MWRGRCNINNIFYLKKKKKYTCKPWLQKLQYSVNTTNNHKLCTCKFRAVIIVQSNTSVLVILSIWYILYMKVNLKDNSFTFYLYIFFLQPHSQQSDVAAEALPAQIELLGSFNSLITSVEQLQSSFLLNPDSFSEGELATPPRKILHTLR